MKVSPLAGKPADLSMLVNVPRLVTAYYTETPDPSVPAQRVAFGTSGHRGSVIRQGVQRMAYPGHQSGHLPVPEAAADRRPAVSRHGHACALRAGAAPARSKCWRPTAWTSCSRSDDEYTPTPAISHAILTYNRGRDDRARRRHRHHAVAQSAR